MELGNANAQRLKVALELRRRLAAFPGDRPTVGTPDDAAQDPSPVRRPAENPGTVMPESPLARVGAR